MWIKKTESEIDRDERHRQETLEKFKVRNLTLVFFCSLLLFFLLFSLIDLTTSGRFIKVYGYPLTFEEYIDSISHFIYSSLVFTLIIFIIALFGYKKIFIKRKSSTYICDRCQVKKTIRNSMTNCDCGGTFNSIDDFKWQDK